MRGVIGAGRRAATKRVAPRSMRVRRWKVSTSPRASSTRERVRVGKSRARRATSSPTTSESSATFCGCSPSTTAASPSFRRTHRPRQCSRDEPDGVFLSNGPGDPDAVAYAPEIVRDDRRRGRPDVRHLPRPPAPRPDLRRRNDEDALWPPRRKSSGARRWRPGRC